MAGRFISEMHGCSSVRTDFWTHPSDLHRTHIPRIFHCHCQLVPPDVCDRRTKFSQKSGFSSVGAWYHWLLCEICEDFREGKRRREEAVMQPDMEKCQTIRVAFRLKSVGMED